jgi:hypothetical protein
MMRWAFLSAVRAFDLERPEGHLDDQTFSSRARQAERHGPPNQVYIYIYISVSTYMNVCIETYIYIYIYIYHVEQMSPRLANHEN